MDKVNFAILGCGRIARQMACTVNKMDSVAPYACAARDLERARAFGYEFGFEKAFGSYEEMLADPAVTLVYIATPHPFHFDQALMCLNHGKHVLCEKPLTLNEEQARVLFETAANKGLLLMEAMWTRFLPIIETLKNLVDEGRLGNVNSIDASLGFVLDSPRDRLPELGGGALLDLGVYPINFASILFGDDIESVSSVVTKSDLGIDEHCSILLKYNNGRIATLYANNRAKTACAGFVHGDNGYAEVSPINNPDCIKIYAKDGSLNEVIDRPAQITGFEYEVEAAVNAIRSGAVEVEKMPSAETERIMRLMDSLREEWGVKYPSES